EVLFIFSKSSSTLSAPISGLRELSRWHIGAIPAISDSVTSSLAVRKHCSLSTINTRHHSTRKRYRCRFPCSADFLITSTLSLLRAVYPKQDIKLVECVLELRRFAAALRPF